MFAILRHITMTKNGQNMAPLSNLSTKDRLERKPISSFPTYNLLAGMTSENAMPLYVTCAALEIQSRSSVDRFTYLTRKRRPRKVLINVKK